MLALDIRRRVPCSTCIVVPLIFAAASVTACGADTPMSGRSAVSGDDSSESTVSMLEPVTIVGAETTNPAELAVETSRALFDSAPAVVVATSGAEVEAAAEQAAEIGVPMLLVEPAALAEPAQETADADDSAAATAPGADDPAAASAQAGIEEIERLEAGAALVMSSESAESLQNYPTFDDEVDVVEDPDDLPDISPAAGNDALAVLVPTDFSDVVTGSAEAAGGTVIVIEGTDLRDDSAAITAMADLDPAQVLAVGDFGSVEDLTARIEVAKTGVELPGGGQALFPGRRMVALYGTPGTPGLGVLGEQDAPASIARAQELAADFQPFSAVPTVPTFEIIATVAQGAAGADGDYSGEIAVEKLRPWVEEAGEEGVYVILDLQPGRANFLDQAKLYEDLLTMPHVGLALDPEWRLTATQKPLEQIGSVEAAEVNSVITWLADLTKEEKLPQKLLVLHQFQLSMLQDTDQIDLTRDEIEVLIHMDGQGTTGQKDSTWGAVVDAAPEGITFGWKNFFDEDSPMLTPEQTMTREPTPFMISYQ